MTSFEYSRITDELLSAYIDNAVTEQERNLVEAAVSADAEIAWRLDSLQQTVEMLHHLPELALPRSFTLQESQLLAERPPAVSEPEPAGSWLQRIATGWRGFWQAGSPVYRNLATASLVLLLVLVVGDVVLSPALSGVNDFAAPAADLAAEEPAAPVVPAESARVQPGQQMEAPEQEIAPVESAAEAESAPIESAPMESPEDETLAGDASAEETSALANVTKDVAPATEPQVAAAAVAEPADEAGEVIAPSPESIDGSAALSGQPLAAEASDAVNGQEGDQFFASPADAGSAPPPALASGAAALQAQEAPIQEESSEAPENAVVAADSAAAREAPADVQDDAIAEGAESESAAITAEAAPLARFAASAAATDTTSLQAESAESVTGDVGTGIVSASTVITDTAAVDVEIAEVAERATATAEESLAGAATTPTEDEVASDDETALAALPTPQPVSPRVTVASQPPESTEADTGFLLRALSLGLAVATLIFGGLWWRSRSRA
jgi:hypothetical protein